MNFDTFAERIARDNLTIYDPITVGDPELWLTAEDLEELLRAKLIGLDVTGMPQKTRSKYVKQHVCEALRYPVPFAFKRTTPQFFGQDFQTYVQKESNLQVWNQELAATRRYAIFDVNPIDNRDLITDVRVVNGAELAKLDTSKKLTTKFQARLKSGATKSELVSCLDTENLRDILPSPPFDKQFHALPTVNPTAHQLLPIEAVYSRIAKLVGFSFPDLGAGQERNRGAALHKQVCIALGYSTYGDTGRFPDVPHQLLEVKLQTAPTVDLGLVHPNSTSALDFPIIQGKQLRECDVRYAVFHATTDGSTVTLTDLLLTTGEDFFTRFNQFQGNVVNKKQQIHLPNDFFNG